MNAQHGRLARQQARRQQRERLAGILLAVVGVVVLVVAIIALHNPKGSGGTAAAGVTATATRTTSVARTPTSTPASSSSTSSAPPVDLSSSASAASSASSSSATVSAKKLRADVPLVVLNNTTTQGLASSAAQRFEQGGWTVTRYGNLANSIISTCAYYDPSVTEAKAAAEALQAQYPTIKRVEPRFDGLDAGPVVVVLTPDYSSE